MAKSQASRGPSSFALPTANPNSVGQTTTPPPIPCHPAPKTHLVVDDDVVLGCHVVGYVVVHDEAQQPIKQGQIYLLIHLLKPGLQHDVALALTCLPHVLQVIDA